MYLEEEDFKKGASILPLAAIDLVIVFKKSILLGLRTNSPGEGMYFVPGGRIRKNEVQKEAFERIWKTENLNVIPSITDYNNAKLLGIYDHIYDTGPLGSNYSSHYVVNAYTIEIANEDSASNILQNSNSQHKNMIWFNLEANPFEFNIHEYSINYIKDLI